MKIVSIIAEYNPFHNGHAYQIHYIREILHADYIVVVMSGDFVQRGAPALLQKQIRARNALENGVDLVLELPVRYATASAEGFAMGAVEILHKLGCIDELCFGSEFGSIEPFQEISRFLTNESEQFKASLFHFLKQGKSFPQSRAIALKKALPGVSLEDFLSAPNNILGVEYCKALHRLHSPIHPVTLKRLGHAYHDTELTGQLFPSASGIRTAFANLKTAAPDIEPENEFQSTLSSQLPEDVLSALMEAGQSDHYLSETDFNLLLHQKLLTAVYDGTLCEYLDVSPSFAKRIENTINHYEDYLTYAELLKTREITYTRIKRCLLHILLNIKNEEAAPLSYARILGFRRDAAPLLKEIKARTQLTLITKPAMEEKQLDPANRKRFQETLYASSLYEAVLCHKTHTPFVHEFQKPLILL